MNSAGIKRGDIVECNVRGDIFYGKVTAKGHKEDARLRGSELRLTPICHSNSGHVRIVTPRQIINHWRKSKQGQRRTEKEDRDGLATAG